MRCRGNEDRPCKGMSAAAPRRGLPSPARAGAGAAPPTMLLLAIVFAVGAARLVAAPPALSALSAPSALSAGAATGFVVVVNSANPLAGLPAAEISKLFMKRITRWDFGAQVTAIDLTEDAPARVAFSKAIHGRPPAAVKAYWQRMIFSGRELPPPESATFVETLTFVRENPGGIGYVPAGTPLPEGVRPFRVLP